MRQPVILHGLPGLLGRPSEELLNEIILRGDFHGELTDLAPDRDYLAQYGYANIVTELAQRGCLDARPIPEKSEPAAN